MHTRTVRWMTTGSVPAGPSPGLVSLRAPSPLFVLASTVFDQVPIATPTSWVPRSGQRNAVSSPFIPRLGPASIKCLLGPLINIPACHYVHVSVRSHSLISSLSIEPPNNYQSRAPTSHPAQPLPAPSETPHQSISLARQIRFPINTLTKNDAPSCSATPHPTCGASATVTRVSEVVIKCASRPRRTAPPLPPTPALCTQRLTPTRTLSSPAYQTQHAPLSPLPGPNEGLRLQRRIYHLNVALHTPRVFQHVRLRQNTTSSHSPQPHTRHLEAARPEAESSP